jgi:hypothetical protein
MTNLFRQQGSGCTLQFLRTWKRRFEQLLRSWDSKASVLADFQDGTAFAKS